MTYASDAIIAEAAKKYAIDPRGIGPFDQAYVPNQHSFTTDGGRQQIDTAVLWLLQEYCPRKREHKGGAYWLKHLAEKWGRAQGFAKYVSTGAMLVALYAVGKDPLAY